MAFETKRPMSIDAQIAAIAAKRESQKAGLESVRLKMMMNESNGLIATMEAIDDETLDKEKHQKALEAMESRRVSEMNRVGMATLEQRLLTEGRRSLQNKFLFEMCYTAHWADDVVKRNTVREMYEAFNDVLDTVDEVVPQVKQSMDASMFLYAVNQVLEATCKKAVARITKEASGEVDPSKISFDLTPEEEMELDQKLSELGKDEIVELVRDKVLTVIQDEKDAGKEKDEMFRQLREECEDEEDDSDPDDELDDNDDVEECLIAVDESLFDIDEFNREFERINRDYERVSAKIEQGRARMNSGNDDFEKRWKQCQDEIARISSNIGNSRMNIERDDQDFDRRYNKIKQNIARNGREIERKSSGQCIDTQRQIDIQRQFDEDCRIMDNMRRQNEEAIHQNENAMWMSMGMFGNGFTGNKSIKLKVPTKYVQMLKKLRKQLNGFKKELGIKSSSKVSESTEITESFIDKEPAPDDFYKLVTNVMRPLGKKFPKAETDKFADPSVMKKKKTRSVRLYVTIGDGLGGGTAKQVASILKASGFKEGNALNTEDFLKLCGKSGVSGAAIGAATGLIAPELLPAATVGAYVANLKSQRIFIRKLSTGFALAFIEFGTTGVTLKIKYKTKLSTARKSAFAMENDEFIDMTPAMQYMAALEQIKIRRELTARSGETIFESLMMLNTKSCVSEVVTEGVNVTDDMVMDAAFIQTVFEYTVLETMNTLGLYHFSTQDSKTLRKAIFEAIDVDIDDDEVDEGLGLPKKAGLKSIRINTKKMKQNNDAKVMGKHSAINKKIIPRFKQSDKDKVAAM